MCNWGLVICETSFKICRWENHKANLVLLNVSGSFSVTDGKNPFNISDVMKYYLSTHDIFIMQYKYIAVSKCNSRLEIRCLYCSPQSDHIVQNIPYFPCPHRRFKWNITPIIIFFVTSTPSSTSPVPYPSSHITIHDKIHISSQTETASEIWIDLQWKEFCSLLEYYFFCSW